MVALTVTAASVIWTSGPIDKDQIAGEAFDAGDMVYKVLATGKWLKAQNDGTAAEAGSDGIGMALATADVALGRVSIARPGAVVAIGTGTAGIVYYVGSVAGDLDPVADLGSTDKVTPAAIGVGSSSVKLIDCYHSGAALA